VSDNRRPTTPKTLAYMQANPDREMMATAIAQEIGCLASSVSTALSRFAESDDVPIERVTRGDGTIIKGLYIYRSGSRRPEPKQSSAASLFETVGTLADGTVVVRNEEGRLARLEWM
jgi:hypothetical protein